MEFKTRVSKMTKDDLVIRGEKLSELVGSKPFTDVVFLLLGERLPNEKESAIFAAMLTSVIDHGMGTASSLSSRFVASTGNPLNTAVGAGVLALGQYHGGAIENAMRQLKEMDDPTSFVSHAVKEKKIMYGFGHKIYKDADPRVEQIHSLCKELGYSSEFIDKAFAAEAALERAKGKKLVLNIDGFIAAVLLEMGFSPEAGNGIFIIARTPGLVAQAVEEKEREKPVRRLSEDEITYDGK